MLQKQKDVQYFVDNSKHACRNGARDPIVEPTSAETSKTGKYTNQI